MKSIAAWFASAGVAAAAIGTLAGVAPIYAIAVAAAVLFVPTLFRPKLLVLAALLMVYAAREVPRATGVEVFGYLDELAVVLVATLLPLHRLAGGERLRRYPGLLPFSAFVAIGLLSAHLNGVAASLAVQGAFLVVKGVLFGYALAQVDWRPSDLAIFAKGGLVVVVVSLVTALINMVLPAHWYALMTNGLLQPDYRGPVASLIGPLPHPGDFGIVMSLLSIGLFAWAKEVRSSPLIWFGVAVTSVAALLSFRRKSILGIVAAVSTLQTRVSRGAAISLLGLAGPLLLFALWGTVSDVISYTRLEYSDPTAAARIVLTVDSWQVAVQHFPFGAGFSRFGTALARDHYSPEYVKLGYESIWGLGNTPDSNHFLTDTSWPALLGEAGVFGAIAFVLGLASIFRSVRGFHTSASPGLQRWLGLTALGWFVQFIVESAAAPVFSAAPTNVLLFGIVGVLVGLDADRMPDARDVVRCSSGSNVRGYGAGASAFVDKRKLWH
ncbi:hypothetical protein [Cryptosporangium phraense]|uniref:O-antigen ligase family protein n=1 Tax=Cryptosporangium phraense TaxID=2593070 RepID=A0A545AJ91_9ACTN|nr:hypothetical protein [Cryptosporangium phraense]TQS41392.1 hypothetical protein FL583_30285 [Cryptosporangium phraense]